jgi:hypothetical protein
MKRIKKIIGVLLSGIFNNIKKKGVIMSLKFYCRWSSTVAYKDILRNYLKYWGSIVGGVLLSPYLFAGFFFEKVYKFSTEILQKGLSTKNYMTSRF